MRTLPIASVKQKTTLELLSKAASSVGVMYRSSGPKTGCNPEEGRIQKTKKKQKSELRTNLKADCFKFHYSYPS